MMKIVRRLAALLLCALLCLPAAGVAAMTEARFTENFEYEDADYPIDLSRQNETGWALANQYDAAFLPSVVELGGGNHALSMKIDKGTVSAHQKIFKNLSDTALTGKLEYRFRVMMPSGEDNGAGGQYNKTGKGDFQVNLDDTGNREMLSFYFSPVGSGVDLRTCAQDPTKPSHADYAVTVSKPDNQPKYDEWIDVAVQLDTDEHTYTFTASSPSGFRYETPADDPFIFRNRYMGGSTGIPKNANTYYFRQSENRLAYVDDMSVGVVIPEKPAPLLSAPVYTKTAAGTETLVDAPEAGFISTRIEVSGLGELDHTRLMLLVAAVNRTTGKIEQVSSVTEQLSPGQNSVTLKTGIEYTDPAAWEYRYFVWDENFASLKNTAPGRIEALNAAAGIRYIDLTWDAPPDDFNAVGHYDIRRDGELVKQVFTSNYRDTGLTEATAYRYEITAFDHEGLASPVTELTATTAKMLRTRLIGDTQAEIDANSANLTFLYNGDIGGGDSYSEVAEKDGVACRKTVNRKPINDKSATYLYFKTNKKFLSENDHNLTLEIIYFDEGTGDISIQYNAAVDQGQDPAKDNIAKNAFVATRTNSMTWKTAVVTLTDAAFREPLALTNCDFRIYGASANPEIYISEVAVIQTEKY